ncbi:helix-turn-helix domain-containing protein [Haladaptatus pallidirubidus]|uniref:Helix-turn-helix domain-containing protein n=1 Tax=Haladaptatus pallidirubidus TaxID=1008152 RepID=A0AAV3UPC5_9EURY|nr:helix-turn-helix domain-containing protein [Haladaptatus pallidirubidus]
MNGYNKTGTSTGSLPTFAEMRDHLGDARQNILTVLHATDTSGVNTSDLREQAGIPSDSMSHHMRKLQRWKLVEEIDREYAGRGSRAFVWSLTARGREFCDDGLELPDDLFGEPEDFEALRTEVSELRNDVEAMKKAMVQIAVKAGGVKQETAQEWLSD